MNWIILTVALLFMEIFTNVAGTENMPEILTPFPNLTAVAGQDVKLSCKVRNLQSYKVGFVQRSKYLVLAIGDYVVSRDPRFSIQNHIGGTWTFSISNVTSQDTGTYHCQINTDPMVSARIHLEVKGRT